MATKKTAAQHEVDIVKINKGVVTLRILGMSPLIYNAMSFKVKQGLLFPQKKTAAERASSLKHDPLAEYRASVYRMRSETSPTLLGFPAVAFKRAMASAALDVGLGKRTQIDRLVWAQGEFIPIWGVPELRMDVVRCKDMDRTPDIRTRAVLSSWCTEVTLSFMQNEQGAGLGGITHEIIVQLVTAAGMVRGIGDFRQEKGAGNYGQFQPVGEESMADFKWIQEQGGRERQEAALLEPNFYDEETQQLFDAWHVQASKRGMLPNGSGKEARA